MPGKAIGEEERQTLILIGELVAASKAASEGLKSISEEVRANSAATMAAVSTLTTLNDKVVRISELILDATNPNNLVSTTAGHAAEIKRIRDELTDLKAIVAEAKEKVEAVDVSTVVHQKVRSKTRKAVAVAIQLLAWSVTTAIAVYAAITQAK